MHGLCLASWSGVGYRTYGVYKGRSGLQKNIQAMLSFGEQAEVHGESSVV